MYVPAELLVLAGGLKEPALLPLLHVPGEHMLREVVRTAAARIKLIKYGIRTPVEKFKQNFQQCMDKNISY